MPARLPVPGSDNGTWGAVLNEYLAVSLDVDGKLLSSAALLAGSVRVSGDIGNTPTTPYVTATHLSAPLPITQGGTGSTTKNFADLTTAQTLTNKRIDQRALTLTAASNVYTPNSANADLVRILSPAANFTIANDAGSPIDGRKMIIRILSNATARTATWSSGYKSSGVATLPTAMVASKTITCGFMYNSTSAAWILMAVDAVGY